MAAPTTGAFTSLSAAESGEPFQSTTMQPAVSMVYSNQGIEGVVLFIHLSFLAQ